MMKKNLLIFLIIFVTYSEENIEAVGEHQTSLSEDTTNDVHDENQSALSEDTSDDANSDNQSTLSEDISNKVSAEAITSLEKARKRTVAGSIMFFSAVIIDYGLLLPVSIKVASDLLEIEQPDIDDLGPSLGLLAASIPVGILKIAGPTIACIGATRSYKVYRKNVDSSIPDITVWKPYKIGWIFIGIGTGIGIVAGVVPDAAALSYVGTGMGVVANVFWAVACIKSYKYANEKEDKATSNKITLIPQIMFKGGGLSFNMEF